MLDRNLVHRSQNILQVEKAPSYGRSWDLKVADQELSNTHSHVAFSPPYSPGYRRMPGVCNTSGHQTIFLLLAMGPSR
jgi:hypothetical protein